MVIEDITINPKDIQVIGKNSDTMKFTFNGITYIKFKAKDLISEISNYSNKISICAAGKANMNYWGGRSVPQVLLDEIEIRETTEFDF
jgi:uncharacterized protein YlzI (FlbEa/FlbD family)